MKPKRSASLLFVRVLWDTSGKTLLPEAGESSSYTIPESLGAHVPTAESNHRPKLVNATITASIQYWERTASRGLR
jgi:hypothetical protein